MKLHRREEHNDRDETVRPRPQRVDEPAPSSSGDAPPEPGLSRRVLWWILAASLLLLIAIVAQHFDEYLRRTIESNVNKRLHGYTVSLGGAHLNPFGLALTLRDAVIRQQAHPAPPVADIDQIKASVQWKEVLRLRLVANVAIDRPRVHVNLKQLQEEDRDSVDVEDRGWQDAFQSIYPLKFNQVQVRDGQFVYIDKDPKRPLELSRVNMIAENIRNTRDDKVLYPSPVRADGVLFGKGRAVVKGHANFLSKPYPGVHVLYQLSQVPLERLDVLGARANLDLDGGILGSKGEVEYSPKHREAHVTALDVDDLRLDYIHTAATASAEKDRAEAVSNAAKDDQPEMLVRVDRLQFRDGNFGLVNRDADHPYRVYVSGTDLTVTNLSSGFRDGAAKAKLKGKFMGSGAARASATFREPSSGPNFDFDIAIEGASLPAMNDLLRSYGKLDVNKGTFSVYSEVKIKDQRIVGYVKPLIKDVDVYDSKQDKKKPVLKKIYEKIVGGLSHVLENRPRDEVATVVDISGPIEDPNTSIWETVVRLVSNAFVKAILPGFDREFDAAQRGR
jgi:hypothetical protein